MSAVPGHAVHRDARAAELGPAHAAVLAAPASLVVMVHDAGADGSEVRGHSRPERLDHAARLVSADDGAARSKAERRGGITRRAVGMKIAAAHARGLDG